MLSMQQSYSGLFRPWDICDDKKGQITDLNSETRTKLDASETKARKRKLDESKRENRLRKIRGQFRRTETLQQDATVSTTTLDIEDKKAKDLKAEIGSHVDTLTQCCDRLLQEPTTMRSQVNIETKPVKSQDTKPLPVTNHDSFPLVPPIYNQHPSYISDYLPTADIAHALGVPPTDPLLLESLAQGYAMELEYARILQQENEAKLLNARKQRPKKYRCPHCQVGFSNNGQLKGHIRIHTGERPYKCDEKNCGKTFTRNEELTRHKRIHSGVRPYPCGTCGKKFGRRDHLKKHARTHYVQSERMMPVFVPLSAMSHVPGFPYLYGY